MERTRLFFVDNLRILLIALVIILHLSVTYGGEGSWYYKEGQADIITSSVLSVHNAIVQSFFMGMLFLIAGYFTPAAFDRKGTRRFLRDRLLRLGVPMLFFDLAIEPIVDYTIMVNVGGFEGTFREVLARRSTFNIGTGPLWFVETLLMFTVVYVVWRKTLGRGAGSGKTDGEMPSNLSIAALAIALGLVTFVVRIWLPIGWVFAPLNFQFPFFPQYICLFVIGVTAYRCNWLGRIPIATGRLWQSIALVFIVVLFPVLFVAGGATTGDLSSYIGGFHWQCFAYALWEQCVGIAMIIGLFVLFRRKFDRQGKLAKELSASSYTVYIIHTPILVSFTLAIRNITLHPLLKFALVAIVAVPLCFALGSFVRKLPLARRIL
jgi:fucose 4-O-acetylase-like acetyltransferase